MGTKFAAFGANKKTRGAILRARCEAAKTHSLYPECKKPTCSGTTLFKQNGECSGSETFNTKAAKFQASTASGNNLCGHKELISAKLPTYRSGQEPRIASQQRSSLSTVAAIGGNTDTGDRRLFITGASKGEVKTVRLPDYYQYNDVATGTGNAERQSWLLS